MHSILRVFLLSDISWFGDVSSLFQSFSEYRDFNWFLIQGELKLEGRRSGGGGVITTCRSVFLFGIQTDGGLWDCSHIQKLQGWLPSNLQFGHERKCSPCGPVCLFTSNVVLSSASCKITCVSLSVLFFSKIPPPFLYIFIFRTANANERILLWFSDIFSMTSCCCPY